jgi:hypothetical protein
MQLKHKETTRELLFKRPAQAQQRHSKAKAKTGKKHGKGRVKTDSYTMQITTTQIIKKALERIVETGLYGTSPAAAAERLLSEGIRLLLKEGTILKVAKILS